MSPETIEYLHKMNIESLDALYDRLIRLAKQGTPDAKQQIPEIIELRARISGDMETLSQQRQELQSLPD
jgi:hypothetical protein